MENNHFECKKVKYASEEFALFDIKRIGNKSNRNKVPVRAYFCSCGSWHLTSKNDKKDLIISDLRLKNFELQKEIELLKKPNREDRIEIRKDKRVKELQAGLNYVQKRNKELLKTNSELVYELVQLKKKYGE